MAENLAIKCELCYKNSVKKLTIISINSLFPGARRRTYRKGQIICYQGDKPSNVFFIVQGHVRYYDIDKNGNEKIMHLMGPNNIFPMLYAYGITADVPAFYSAIDTVEVITIPLQDFLNVLKSNIEFSNLLAGWFLVELDELAYRINSLEKTDARSKVLNAIKYMALHYGRSHGLWQQINFPITQQFIADFTGLTRETVSSTIQELEKDKIVTSRRTLKLDIKRSELKKPL